MDTVGLRCKTYNIDFDIYVADDVDITMEFCPFCGNNTGECLYSEESYEEDYPGEDDEYDGLEDDEL